MDLCHPTLRIKLPRVRLPNFQTTTGEAKHQEQQKMQKALEGQGDSNGFMMCTILVKIQCFKTCHFELPQQFVLADTSKRVFLGTLPGHTRV